MLRGQFRCAHRHALSAFATAQVLATTLRRPRLPSQEEFAMRNNIIHSASDGAPIHVYNSVLSVALMPLAAALSSVLGN